MALTSHTLAAVMVAVGGAGLKDSVKMRDDLPEGFMWELYNTLIQRGIDAELCERYGLTRKEGMLAAAGVWGLGTVRRSDLAGDLKRVKAAAKKAAGTRKSSATRKKKARAR